MRDHDKELRGAVERLLKTTSTYYKDVPLVEIKELPNVGAAWENVKDKLTALEVLEKVSAIVVKARKMNEASACYYMADEIEKLKRGSVK